MLLRRDSIRDRGSAPERSSLSLLSMSQGVWRRILGIWRIGERRRVLLAKRRSAVDSAHGRQRLGCRLLPALWLDVVRFISRQGSGRHFGYRERRSWSTPDHAHLRR